MHKAVSIIIVLFILVLIMIGISKFNSLQDQTELSDKKILRYYIFNVNLSFRMEILCEGCVSLLPQQFFVMMSLYCPQEGTTRNMNELNCVKSIQQIRWKSSAVEQRTTLLSRLSPRVSAYSYKPLIAEKANISMKITNLGDLGPACDHMK